MGLTANGVTILGTISSVMAAILLIPNGHLLAASLALTGFLLFDLLDGTMARLSEQGTNKWGALLDSSLDRISDAALLGSLLWYLEKNNQTLSVVVLINIVLGFLISYIKAKAESLDIECNGGFAERTERLIITLVAVGVAGLGFSVALVIGMWVLLIASLVTVVQRFQIVHQSSK